MKTIEAFDFKGKKVLVRVDFNVPLDKSFRVTDDTRIRAAVPTIKKILASGGSPILMSHLGRPKTGPEEKFSLKHLLPVLEKLLGVSIFFAHDCIGQEAVDLAASLKENELLLLENLRFYKEEEKGDRDFAGKLAALGEVYVNDAFGTAHRAHASTAIISEFFPTSKLAGFLLEEEVSNLKKVLESPVKPFTAIIGGAKVSDKILIIQRLIEKVDHLIIGGGMSYTFFKAMGFSIGKSLVEDDKISVAIEIIKTAKKRGVSLHLPEDSVVADAFDNGAITKISSSNSIPDGWMGLDIGPEARKKFSEIIQSSKTLLWNGPMGVFEMSAFEAGTKEVAHAISGATEQGSYSLVGGGDSLAAVNKYNLAEKVSYVSTGGGAMLEFLEGKILPGVAALEN